MSRDNLALSEADPERFLQEFATVDETWIHHLQPETKEQSKQWKHPDSQARMKAESARYAGKVMACFLRCKVLLVNYLVKGHTITWAYYADPLRQLGV